MTSSLTTYSYWLPKQGKRDDEYEDAYACSGTGQYPVLPVSFALADGASTSAFAQEWATMLVEDFVTHWEPGISLATRVTVLRHEWAKRLHTSSNNLPWFAQHKARAGSFATLLGVLLEDGGSWQAVAVGDSCLFQMRGGKLVATFPIEHAANFNNTPALLHSNFSASYTGEPIEHQCTGTWQAGDRLLLMTDALAEWFVRCAEQDTNPWDTIAHRLDPLVDQAEQHARFQEWVRELWEHHELRNDDVTLLILDVQNNDTPISSSK